MGASPTTERLVEHIVAGVPGDALGDELLAWVRASRRFRAFANTNRDKILVAVVAWHASAQNDPAAVAWVNTTARTAVPPRALRALLACLDAR